MASIIRRLNVKQFSSIRGKTLLKGYQGSTVFLTNLNSNSLDFETGYITLTVFITTQLISVLYIFSYI